MWFLRGGCEVPGRRLSIEEQGELSRGLVTGESLRSIAGRLGRPASTLSREVARNGGMAHDRAARAHRAAHARARRPKKHKLACHPHLAQAVETGLKKRWSPEQIANRLRLEHPARAILVGVARGDLPVPLRPRPRRASGRARGSASHRPNLPAQEGTEPRPGQAWPYRRPGPHLRASRRGRGPSRPRPLYRAISSSAGPAAPRSPPWSSARPVSSSSCTCRVIARPRPFATPCSARSPRFPRRCCARSPRPGQGDGHARRLQGGHRYPDLLLRAPPPLAA
ncbi:transposase [Aciditerrimonas ferrireducens]|uniref:Transposase n=1 Tax=Aciditerrimonas ferrireducens TaxID=667306 RepID=A0ABV6C5D1_9ACTN